MDVTGQGVENGADLLVKVIPGLSVDPGRGRGARSKVGQFRGMFINIRQLLTLHT